MALIVFLRGINVGGKNSLPMRDLSVMFNDSGCTEVATYIQSGNVIFTASAQVAKRLAKEIEDGVEKRFGHRPPVILRTGAELALAAQRNPFLKKKGHDEQLQYVMFLADTPSASAVKALDPDRSPPDQFVVLGKEIYLSLPNGAGRSKLTNAYFDSRLSTISTARNWRTVLKLVELTTA